MTRALVALVALALPLAAAACDDTAGVPPDANRLVDAPFFDIDGPPPLFCANGQPEGPNEACTQPSWQFIQLDPDGVTPQGTACPSGFGTAAIIGQKTTAKGVPLAPCDPSATTNATTCFVDLYDCNVQNGSQILPRGFATQQIAITNQDGTSIYGMGPPQFEILDGSTFVGGFVNLVANGGYIRTSWSLSRNGSPATCVSVGGSPDVTIATSFSFAEFPCDNGDDLFNYTTMHLAGTYTVTAQVIDRTTGATIGSAATTQVTVGMHDDLAIANPIALTVP